MSGSAAAPLRRTIRIPAQPYSDEVPRNALGPVQALQGFAQAGVEAGLDVLQQKKRLADIADQKLEAARIEADLVDRRLKAATALNDLSDRLEKDEDYRSAPQRFSDDAARLQDDLGAGISDPEARNSFNLEFGRLSEARRIALKQVSLTRETSAAVATLDESLETFARQASAAPNAVVRRELFEQASKGVAGLVDTGMLTAEEGQRRMRLFRERNADYDARRAVFLDPVAAKKALESGAVPDLDPIRRQELIERSQSEIDQRARAVTEAQREARISAREMLLELDQTLAAGFVPTEDMVSDVRAAVGTAGDRALTGRLGRSMAALTVAQRLRGATPQEVTSALTELDKAGRGGANAQVAQAAQSARGFLGQMNSGLRDDPLMWASRQGVASVEPLQLNGKDDPRAIRQRILIADRVAERYNIAPRYMTEAEETGLTAELAKLPPGPKLDRAALLVKSFGARAPDVLRRVAPNEPILAQAGELLLLGPQHAIAARDALTGEAAIRSANAQGRDLRPSATFRQQNPVALDLSRAFAMLPGDRERTLDAGDAIYVARAPGAGRTGGADTDETTYERALQEAAGARFDADGTQWGGITNYRGQPVVAPSSIEADRLDDVMHALTNEDLARAGVPPVRADGQKFDAKDFRYTYLMSVGNGKYLVSVTDPSRGNPQILRDPIAPAGRDAYVLDLGLILQMKGGR